MPSISIHYHFNVEHEGGIKNLCKRSISLRTVDQCNVEYVSFNSNL